MYKKNKKSICSTNISAIILLNHESNKDILQPSARAPPSSSSFFFDRSRNVECEVLITRIKNECTKNPVNKPFGGVDVESKSSKNMILSVGGYKSIGADFIRSVRFRCRLFTSVQSVQDGCFWI